MRNLLLIISSTIALLCSFTLVSAAGNSEAGKVKSAVCAACHGADGNGMNPTFPNLAGQVPGYIENQLILFKEDQRKDPIMAGMAKPLSADDMKDLDAYFSGLPTKQRTIPAESVSLAKAGEIIFRGGNKKSGVPACMGCHGPSGHGVPPQFPKLAGQSPTYIKKQLNDFKSGLRKDSLKIMSDISFRLTKNEINGLSAYVEGLK
jgi:cytochrome c553